MAMSSMIDNFQKYIKIKKKLFHKKTENYKKKIRKTPVSDHPSISIE